MVIVTNNFEAENKKIEKVCFDARTCTKIQSNALYYSTNIVLLNHPLSTNKRCDLIINFSLFSGKSRFAAKIC